MIKKVQKKFIKVTSLALSVVILLLIVSVNLINLYTNTKDLNNVLDVIIMNGGNLPKNNKPNSDIEFKKNIIFENDKANREKFFTTRFSTIILNSNKDVEHINSDNISALSNNEIIEYTEKIILSNKNTGWIDGYKYRISLTPSGYIIVLLDGYPTIKTLLTIFIISIFVALIGFFIGFTIIVLFSKRAIYPIVEGYEKQKQFITNASHELKTPLTIISANSQIISMLHGNDEWVEGIEKQCGRMTNLINRLITLSKLDEDKPNTFFDKFSLSDAAYDTAIAFEGLCKNKHNILDIDINNNIDLVGDESSIREVISILLDNAIKYCDEGSQIAISLKKDNHINLKVSNYYKDIKNIKLSDLFDRFYRVEKSRSTKGSYGLGLSIAQSIVNNHGGKIKAKNIDNKIIEFHIIF